MKRRYRRILRLILEVLLAFYAASMASLGIIILLGFIVVFFPIAPIWTGLMVGANTLVCFGALYLACDYFVEGGHNGKR